MKNRIFISIYFNKMYTYIINQKQYMQTKVFLVALALILSVNTQIDWDDQDNWGGACEWCSAKNLQKFGFRSF